MNYLLAILGILGVAYLGGKWLDYLKASRSSSGYAMRRMVSLLFLGFMALISVTSIFAEAIFEYLKLKKPDEFEWMAFGAYVVFAVATVFIVRSGKGNTADGPSTQEKNIIKNSNVTVGGNLHVGDKNN